MGISTRRLYEVYDTCCLTATQKLINLINQRNKIVGTQ